jgi:hypothetical protein
LANNMVAGVSQGGGQPPLKCFFGFNIFYF